MVEWDFLIRYPQYVQLIGVGLLWISLHCAGMCGPIVVGLDLGDNLLNQEWKKKSKVKRLLHSIGHLTAYQIGRSITYAVLGALAGLGGAIIQEFLGKISKVSGLVIAAMLILYGAVRLSGAVRGELFGESGKLGKMLGKTAGRLQRFPGLTRKLLLGLVLGFLPCMITFWALGLAASTQSPVHGALLMILLVWMTSFVIFTFGFFPALAPARFNLWREKLLSIFLILSGIWLGLNAAAANEWIGHAALGFSLGGRGFAIMFW
jgi:sulfite exporter TauE/SafE